MKSKIKKMIWPSIILLFVVITSNIVISQNEINNPGLYIDTTIYKAFESNEWIKVIIDIKNITETDNLFSTFPNNEIRDIKKREHSPRVSAEINREGFNRLINDTRVKAIYFNAPAYAIDSKNETEDKKEKIEYGSNNQYDILKIVIISIIIILISYLLIRIIMKFRKILK